MHRLTLFAAASSMLAIGCGASPVAPTPPSANPQLSVPFTPSAVASSTFTFTIDSACRSRFPEAVHQRSYRATASGEYTGLLRLDGNFVPNAAPRMDWNVIYRSSRHGSTSLNFNDPPLWERLIPESYLLIYGGSDYRSTSEYGEWPFWGRVTFCAAMTKPDSFPCAVPEITCESANHRLRVTQN